ncbi:protein S40-4 [Rosa sericea]
MLQIPLWNLGKVVVLGGTSQSEKGRQPPMEDTYLSRQGSGVWRSLRDGDFEEEDVWNVLRDRKTSNTMTGRSKESSVSVPRRLPTASRMIPRASSHNYGSGSSCSSSNNTHEAKIVQQSAPVHIPNWSEAYGQKSKKGFKNSSWHNECDDADDDDEDGDLDDEDEEEEEDDYDSKEPPHEFIARRLARSQISSFSVCEGAGRTLKGRDLSKVRNAVLIKTGFLESL